MSHAPVYVQPLLFAFGNSEGVEEAAFGAAGSARYRPWRCD